VPDELDNIFPHPITRSQSTEGSSGRVGTTMPLSIPFRSRARSRSLDQKVQTRSGNSSITIFDRSTSPAGRAAGASIERPADFAQRRTVVDLYNEDNSFDEDESLAGGSAEGIFDGTVGDGNRHSLPPCFGRTCAQSTQSSAEGETFTGDYLDRMRRIYGMNPNAPLLRRPHPPLQRSNAETGLSLALTMRRLGIRPLAHVGDLPKFDADGNPIDLKANCSICMTALEDQSRAGSIPCGHIFHRECINRWLRSKNDCPLCRRNFDTDP
jgi:hypothetical protein